MNPNKDSQCLSSQGNQDRFKDLGDLVVSNRILCFLDMKDVVKTSVLSKRWKLLWTKADTIIYTCHFDATTPFDEEKWNKYKDYASFIDNTLIKIARPIRRFSLAGFDGLSMTGSFDFDFSDLGDKIKEWVEYVSESKVEILKLDYNGFRDFIPSSVFNCSSLTDLKLAYVLMNLQRSVVNLPSLKSLSLDHTSVHELEQILMGCPVLEALVLKENRGTNVRIISPSLKRLKIVGGPVSLTDDVTLEIRTPSLQELEIASSFFVRKFVTADLSSLVKANLMFTVFVDEEDDVFQHDWIHMVEGLLKSVCHVGELLISSDILQVLTLSAVLDNISTTFMCKHVTIVSPLWKYDLPGIVYLLKASPHLETLMVDVSMSEINPSIDQAGETLSVENLISYANGNLENVNISYQQNPCGTYALNNIQVERKCLDFELVNYILKSCISLERILLCPSRVCISDMCSTPNCAFQHVNQLSSKLLSHSLPQNENAEWELKKVKFSLEYTFSNYTSVAFEG